MRYSKNIFLNNLSFLFKGFLLCTLFANPRLMSSQVSVKASIDHVKNDGIDAQGNIILTVSGGTSPYTYSWSPGSITTKDLTNATIGTYTVKVNDNAGSNSLYYYNLGYKIDWYKYYGLKFRNDTLMSDGSTVSGSRTSISKNSIPKYTNGWLQFVAPSTSTSYVVGFLDSVSVSTNNDIYDIDFAFHLTSTNLLYAWAGGNFTYLTTVSGGDVIKIERVGNTYYLRKNNTSLYSYTTLLHKKLKAKVLTNGDVVANIGVSFNDTTYLEKLTAPALAIDHFDPVDTDTAGTISFKIQSGSSPYSVSWKNSSGIVTQDLIEKPKDNYTVTVKDANSDSVITYVGLGYKAIWKDYWGTSSIRDTLISNAAGTPSGSPSAFTINELRASTAGWVQYVVQKYDSPFVVGFADTMLAGYRGSTNDLNFAFHITTGYALYGWNGGWNYLGTTKQGDIIKMEKSGTTFTLRKNNSSLFTHTATNSKNYKVKALLNNYMRLGSLGMSFADSTTGRTLKAYAFIDHLIPETDDSLGNFEVRITGGRSPYTFSWSPGNTSSRFKLNANKNTYSFKVKDSKKDSLVYTYRMGNKMIWGTFYGTTQSNDTLKSNGSGGYTNRTAYSKSKLGSGVDGWVEFIYKTSELPLVVGFLDSTIATYNAGHEDIDYGVHITTGNALYVWNGSWTYLGTASENDVIKVERTSNVFYLKKNTTTVHSQTGINKDLAVKGLINNSILMNIATSFISPPFSLSSTVNNTHYAILNRKLDAGYHTYVGSPKILYFKFDEEYYVPSSTNLVYKVYDNTGAIVSLSSLIEKIGDNRFALNVNTLSTSSPNGPYYKLYVYNRKNEVWKTRFKVN